jgi:hypothetical protein
MSELGPFFKRLLSGPGTPRSDLSLNYCARLCPVRVGAQSQVCRRCSVMSDAFCHNFGPVLAAAANKKMPVGELFEQSLDCWSAIEGAGDIGRVFWRRTKEKRRPGREQGPAHLCRILPEVLVCCDRRNGELPGLG